MSFVPRLSLRLPSARFGRILALAGGMVLPFGLPSFGMGDFPVVPSATTAEVRAFLAAGQGGPAAKLVYVDNKSNSGGPLNFIDFSAGANPAVQRIAAITAAKVPVISPDGEWVVYAQGEGGPAGSPVSRRSSAYLCRLAAGAQPFLVRADSAHEPRFAFSQKNPKILTVHYLTVAPDAAWEPRWGSKTLAVDIDVSSGTPVLGMPRLVVAGGYSGGMSHDGRWLSGGGDGGAGRGAVLDLQSGRNAPDTVAARFPLKAQGAAAYPSARREPAGQACNVSHSPSRVHPDAFLYLDFGSGGLVNDQVAGGRPWEKWGVIFVTDSKARNLRAIPLPGTYAHPLETLPDSSLDKAKWHHPEWSNHPHFAVATLNVDRYFKNPADGSYRNTAYQERLYLLNLKNGTTREVLRPEKILFNPSWAGMHWPHLWVQVPEGFTETADWMATSPVRRVKEGASFGMRIQGNRLQAGKTLRSVEVRSLDGRLLRRLLPGGEGMRREGKEVELPCEQGHDLLLLRARFADGTSASLLHRP